MAGIKATDKMVQCHETIDHPITIIDDFYFSILHDLAEQGVWLLYCCFYSSTFAFTYLFLYQMKRNKNLDLVGIKMRSEFKSFFP